MATSAGRRAVRWFARFGSGLQLTSYMEIFFLCEYPFYGVCFRCMLTIEFPLNKTVDSYLNENTVLCEVEDGL